LTAGTTRWSVHPGFKSSSYPGSQTIIEFLCSKDVSTMRLYERFAGFTIFINVASAEMTFSPSGRTTGVTDDLTCNEVITPAGTLPPVVLCAAGKVVACGTVLSAVEPWVNCRGVWTNMTLVMRHHSHLERQTRSGGIRSAEKTSPCFLVS
jgi:hypothetical protein